MNSDAGTPRRVDAATGGKSFSPRPRVSHSARLFFLPTFFLLLYAAAAATSVVNLNSSPSAVAVTVCPGTISPRSSLTASGFWMSV